MRSSLAVMKWGILGLFFISGAPALLYQVIWQHHLYTIYGAHAESVAIIVGAFMFGLGIGSLVGGEISLRWRRSPFYMFAIIETLIGVFGFFSLSLFDAVGSMTTHLGVLGAGIASFALVVVPTIAMGATLPILANTLIARLKNVGVSIGNLYFVNTLGSACAALASVFLLGSGFGQHGLILIAVALNIFVVLVSLLLRTLSERYGKEADGIAMKSDTHESPDETRKRMFFASVLSFYSGFLALSVEILWFRVIFILTNGRAFAFPVSLGFFLFGIAFGSFYATRLMGKRSNATPRELRRIAAIIMLVSSIVISGGFMLVGTLATAGMWVLSFLATTLISFPLGVLFPVLMHSGVIPDRNAGRSVSRIYAANILGSTLGSIGTGFILLDHMSLRSIVLMLSLISSALAIMLARRAVRGRVLLLFAIALVVAITGYRLSAELYEKLQYLQSFTKATHFAKVVENRSGVIAVTQDDVVYGTGVYDGRFSTDLVNDKNIIIRPFALSAFHANPKRILVIGLSSGSWVQVLANLPGVERIDVLEINPGYLELIPQYPVVASLLTNPKVHITIEDGRRFLVRNPEEAYDMIVMNTTFYWRAGASNLLSAELLTLLRSHLYKDGLVIYNTTGSPIVFKTGLSVFPYGWRISNNVIVSDSPLPIDRDRLLQTLREYRIDGKPVLDLTTASGTAALEKIKMEFDPTQQFSSTTLLETRAQVLSRVHSYPTVTDDNMIIEWGHK